MFLNVQLMIHAYTERIVGMSVRGDNQMNDSVVYCGLKKEMFFYLI